MSIVSVSCPRVIVRYTSARSWASSSAPCTDRWALSTPKRSQSASRLLRLPGNISRASASVSIDARMELGARGKRGALELGVEKSDVERRVVDDPFRAARERDEFRGDLREFRLVLEVVPGHPVHFGRAGVDLALGVETEMDGAAGRAAVGDLERGELDDPVALLGVEPRGLGVDDDLAHAGWR